MDPIGSSIFFCMLDLNIKISLKQTKNNNAERQNIDLNQKLPEQQQDH